jgi:hypothetical protein
MFPLTITIFSDVKSPKPTLTLPLEPLNNEKELFNRIAEGDEIPIPYLYYFVNKMYGISISHKYQRYITCDLAPVDSAGRL